LPFIKRGFLMKIYSTMSRKKEELKVISQNKVKLFVCGPTVYHDAHIGHGRTYIFFDVIKRYLKFIGYSVFYIQNITDIDDKIIKKAELSKSEPNDIAKIFEKRYLEDMYLLNVTSVNKYARTTDYIDEIINQIERIMARGFAYETSDGIYFDVKKFKDYGKLSNVDIKELENHREIEEVNKKNPQDFVLWKKRRSSSEPVWDSPWGKGRPGWHIEDTAITEYYFGNQYDIHGGGLDLMFPHHEAEIAQLKAINDKAIVNYWMHTGFLNVSGFKMSKSLNNFVTIRDLLKEVSTQSFRFFVISSHYRSHVEFSKEDIVKCEKALRRIKNFTKILNERNIYENIKPKEDIVYEPLKKCREEFFKGMNDDFNTPVALSAIFSFINDSKKDLIDDKIPMSDIINALIFFDEASIILGIDFNSELDIYKKDSCSEDLLNLINDVRKKLREDKNYELSDEIRDKLHDLGIDIND
jgi:cysteinyl-tRNA synthetase